MIISKNKAWFILLGVFLVSCRPEKTEKEEEKKWSQAHSVDFNSEINEREQLQINTFLEHYSFLKMKTSSSGLRYMIYDSTDNQKCRKGEVVEAKIIIRTLDMQLCYQTDSISEYEELQIGKSDIESGIQEVLTLMRRGEKARCILPSYLGHGLIGYHYNIPPQSLLYVDIQVKPNENK